MEKLLEIGWQELFIPTHSLAEMIVRGTVMYVALFLILRFGMKRQAGSIGIADILVIVVVADAAQNAFSKDYRSLTEGMLLVATIVFWDFFVDWASYRFPGFGRLLQPAPLPLIKDGKMIRRNMRQEYITDDEMQSQLRKAGIEDIRKVKLASMEPDGEISIIKQEGDLAPEKPRRPRKTRPR